MQRGGVTDRAVGSGHGVRVHLRWSEAQRIRLSPHLPVAAGPAGTHRLPPPAHTPRPRPARPVHARLPSAAQVVPTVTASSVRLRTSAWRRLPPAGHGRQHAAPHAANTPTADHHGDGGDVGTAGDDGAAGASSDVGAVGAPGTAAYTDSGGDRELSHDPRDVVVTDKPHHRARAGREQLPAHRRFAAAGRAARALPAAHQHHARVHQVAPAAHVRSAPAHVRAAPDHDAAPAHHVVRRATRRAPSAGRPAPLLQPAAPLHGRVTAAPELGVRSAGSFAERPPPVARHVRSRPHAGPGRHGTSGAGELTQRAVRSAAVRHRAQSTAQPSDYDASRHVGHTATAGRAATPKWHATADRDDATPGWNAPSGHDVWTPAATSTDE